MHEDCAKLLRRTLKDDDYQRLVALDSPKLHRFVADAVELCEPDTVLVVDDSPESAAVTAR